MAQPQYHLRLKRELKALLSEPVPNILALPNKNNILEWHYVIFGPKGTPYEGGVYHGKIVFPPEYPNKPPSIQMITPNGRFQTNKRLCLSMSDYHPETWNCLWSVSSILTGLLSFMLENTQTAGSVITSNTEKQQHAMRSMKFNQANPVFRKMFPQLLETSSEPQAEDATEVVGNITESKEKLPDNEHSYSIPLLLCGAAVVAALVLLNSLL